MKPHAMPPSVTSLDGEWLIAVDPGNEGRDREWFAGPVKAAKPTTVPWIIQDAFPGYHGVAWYWRDFEAPANPHRGGRFLLRFQAVDYLADVWLNGTHVGGHEGGETPFVLDVTEAVRLRKRNQLAVRVLNPTDEPVDGIVLNQTPHANKGIPCTAGASCNHGGIVDSVEIVVVPAVWIEDFFVRPDPKTGAIAVCVNVRNTRDGPARVRLELAVAPAANGETLGIAREDDELPSGDTLLEKRLQVEAPRLWELNDPYLYRVTARVRAGRSGSFDERSVRCGFRDFRFEDGYFRLNGRRLFLRSSHTLNHTPVGQRVPHDKDLLRRDLLNVKVMGCNAIRFIAGMATGYQLELCDEIGLMVLEEHSAGWLLEDSPEMAERYDTSITEMIRRDRNHASVVGWGLLNETEDGPVFRRAVGLLPAVRALDASRMVLLGSGRWDGRLSIGSISNPGSDVWEHLLGGEDPGAAATKRIVGIPADRTSYPGGYCEGVGDVHVYPRVPHYPETIEFIRALGRGTKPVYLSEYGIGSAVDLWRLTRHFERLGKDGAEDAQFYRDKLDRFMADWERWRLAECFARPEDFFAACVRKMAGQRTLGLNAIRSNPGIVGYGVTGTMDQALTGEGLTTTFRELKPGTVDAMFEGFAPLRWCLFVEPANVYSGTAVRLEAVLANEDVLAPGVYPARVQVVGQDGTRVFERALTVTVRDGEPPLAMPVFEEDVMIEGASGRYRFLATLERGGAPTGGETEFFISDPAAMPRVDAQVALWGDDPELSGWLGAHGIRVRPYASGEPTAREVILVSGKPAAPGGAGEWMELTTRIGRGATAVFLSPEVFAKGDVPLGWLPLAGKGELLEIVGWLYLKDEWAKRHPIFDGLPSGGLMDYTFYRDLIPDTVFSGQDPPAEAVAGAIKASQDYESGLLVSVHGLGAGRFFLNTLRIRENLGSHPGAERLLRNMLCYAARDMEEPLALLPDGYDAQMGRMR